MTAQRREQNLDSVGSTVVAQTGEALVTKGVTDIHDLSKVVPGLTVADTSYGTPVLTLRGVGFYESSLASTSPVATYIDEAPIPYTRMASGATLDLQRVEVVEGPQGTLYGENSTGGAINYVTNKPTSRPEAGFDASLGRFLDSDVQGFVSGPLADGLEARVAIRSHYSDGWQESVSRPGDTLGAARFLAGRTLLDWRPLGRLHFELNLNGFIDKSDDQAYQATSFQPNVPAAVQPAELSARLTPTGNDRLADWDADKKFRRNNYQYQAALRATYEISTTLQLISITSYQNFNEHQLVDTDGTDAEANDILQAGHIGSVSQELRLQSSGTPLKWVAGANYSRDSIYEYDLYIVGDGSQAHSVPGYPFEIGRTQTSQHADTYAAFANADYQLLPKLDVQGGVRYTDQSRDFNGCIGDPGPVGGGAWARLFSYLYNTTIPLGGCTTLNPTTGVVGAYTSSDTEDNVSWRGALNYKPEAHTLLYVTVSQGYKQGNYPTLGGSSTVQYTPAKQEGLLAYEVGTKIGLLDHRLQVNAAGFYYDYSNKQLRGKYTDPVFGTIEELFNIPKSRVYGYDLQLVAVPFSGLNVQGEVTYANSRILSNFPNLSPIGQPINLKGESFELTPELSAKIDISYEHSIGGGALRAFGGVDATYQGDQHGGYGYDPLFNIDAYALTDFYVGVRSPEQRWRLQAWLRNAFNTYYWTNANYLGEFSYRQAGIPRTFGGTLSYRF